MAYALASEILVSTIVSPKSPQEFKLSSKMQSMVPRPQLIRTCRIGLGLWWRGKSFTRGA